MDKPLSIRKEEFESSLVQLINNSGLPAYILEPILRSYNMEVKELCRAQAEREKLQYEESLRNEEVTANEQEGQN